MANRKITDLPNSAALSGSESFILDQASLVDITGFNTVKTSLDDIRSYVTTGTPGLDIDGNVTIDGTVKLSGSLSARDDLEVQNLSAYNSLYVGEGGIDVTGGIDVALGDLDVQAGSQILSGGFDLFDIFGSGGAGAGTLLQVTINGNETTEAACFGGTLSAQNFLASTDLNQNKPFETTNSILGGLEHCNYSEFSTIVSGLSNVTAEAHSVTIGGTDNRVVGTAAGAATVFGFRNTIGANPGQDSTLYTVGSGSSILGGYKNCITKGEGGYEVSRLGAFSVIVGGQLNCIIDAGPQNFIGAGSLNRICCAASFSNIIVGGNDNDICNSHLTNIGGGTCNTIRCGHTSLIAGGLDNFIDDANCSTVGGGYLGKICGTCYGTVAGGKMNQVIPTGDCGAILGGSCNAVAGEASGIVAGENNIILGERSAIAGGHENCAQGSCNFIGTAKCGITNSAAYQLIGTGFNNRTFAEHSVILGGLDNCNRQSYSTVLAPSGSTNNSAYGLVAAGKGNFSSCNFSTVLGGCFNSVVGPFNTGINGFDNCIQGTQSCWNTIINGQTGCVKNRSCYNTLGGVNGGFVNDDISYSTIFGSGGANIYGHACNSTIIGSINSNISCGSCHSTIIGSRESTICTSVSGSTILGLTDFNATSANTTYVCHLSVGGTPRFATGFSGNIAGCSTITVTNGIITAAS